MPQNNLMTSEDFSENLIKEVELAITKGTTASLINGSIKIGRLIESYNTQLIRSTLEAAAERVRGKYWALGDPAYCDGINEAIAAILEPPSKEAPDDV
jgi:hypothetical protein